MTRRTRVAIAAGFLLVLVAAIPGCEDTPLTAPGDGTIRITATPPEVTINPNLESTPVDPVSGLHMGTSDILVRVFRKDGVPMEGVSVTFSGGRLTDINDVTKPVGAVDTDNTGSAWAKLVLLEDAAAESYEITGASAALTGSVTVTLNLRPDNKLPRASIATSPLNQALANHQVIFDGSNSSDEDGTITAYRWTITSDHCCCLGNCPTGVQCPTPACPQNEVVGTTALETPFSLERIYEDAQTLTVKLEVTDDPFAVAKLTADPPLPVTYQDSQVISYAILCDNEAPVANAGPDQTRTGALGSLVPVVLDGRNSTDDKTIDRYVWNCGNGELATPVVAGDWRMVTCRYGIGEYTATLTVYDNGTGVQVGGNWECQASATDTAGVKVTNPPE